MAFSLASSSDVVAITVVNKFIVYKIGSGNVDIFECTLPAEDKTLPSRMLEGSDTILAVALSSDGLWFGVADDYKRLFVWTRVEGNRWTLHSQRDTGRRATSLCFTPKAMLLLVADKSGDVFRYQVEDKEDKGQLLLGHVSMLLDLELCGSECMYLATCDRDEKIRVSHFPNCYSVQSFCMGHAEFVSCLVYLQDVQLLVSGSGDGTVALWNYETGTQLHSINCSELVKDLPIWPTQSSTHRQELETTVQLHTNHCAQVSSITYSPTQRMLAVAFDRRNLVVILGHTDHQLSVLGQVTLEQRILTQTLDQSGRLWCIQTHPERALKVYRVERHTDHVQVHEDIGEELKVVIDGFNRQYGKDLQDSSSIDSIYPYLHKVRVDNMKDYIEKKTHRMDSLTSNKKIKLG